MPAAHDLVVVEQEDSDGTAPLADHVATPPACAGACAGTTSTGAGLASSNARTVAPRWSNGRCSWARRTTTRSAAFASDTRTLAAWPWTTRVSTGRWGYWSRQVPSASLEQLFSQGLPVVGVRLRLDAVEVGIGQLPGVHDGDGGTERRGLGVRRGHQVRRVVRPADADHDRAAALGVAPRPPVTRYDDHGTPGVRGDAGRRGAGEESSEAVAGLATDHDQLGVGRAVDDAADAAAVGHHRRDGQAGSEVSGVLGGAGEHVACVRLEIGRLDRPERGHRHGHGHHVQDPQLGSARPRLLDGIAQRAVARRRAVGGEDDWCCGGVAGGHGSRLS